MSSISIKRTFIFEVPDEPAWREIFCPLAFSLKPGIRDTASPADMFLMKSRRSMSAAFKKSSLLSFVARYFYDDSGYLKRAGESRCICRTPAKSCCSEQRNLTERICRLIMTLICAVLKQSRIQLKKQFSDYEVDPGTDEFILLESDDFFLLESSDQLIKE